MDQREDLEDELRFERCLYFPATMGAQVTSWEENYSWKKLSSFRIDFPYKVFLK